MYDAMLGWLHDSAELSHAELVAQFDQANRQKLEQLVNHCLEGQTVPATLSADEFAHWIHDLRDSERDWNRSLGSVLLKAEDVHASGDQSGAVRLLEEFASQCSWLPLREIAEGEASRYAAG